MKNMKHMKKVSWLCIGLLLCLFSCDSSDDQSESYDVGNAVAFESSIVNMEVARAISDSWSAGDEIGISMVKNGTTLILHNARNVKYTADTNGNLSAAAEAIHYPADIQTGVDFMAYYPYQPSLDNFTYRVQLSDQTQPATIDLLYSNNILNATDEEASVNLQFSHKLTKLIFNISAGQGIEESSLQNLNVYINGLHTEADFNLATGLLQNIRTNETITALTATDGKQAQVIVLPESGILYSLDFVLSNSAAFEWKAETPVTLFEGKIHTFNVIVGTSQVEISEGEITDWTGVNDDPINGIGKPVPVVKYAVGDVYPKEGTPLGIVYEISNGGKSGKVVSLKEKQDRWGDNSKDESADGVEFILDIDAGKQATVNLIAKRRSAGNFANDYVIFYWLYNELNEADVDGAWYLPSKNELKALYAGLSGLTYADIETTWTDGQAMPGFDSKACQDARTAFNNAVKAAGGTEFNFYGQYWAVTEISSNVVWSVHFQTSVLQTGKSKGDSYGRARAILAF